MGYIKIGEIRDFGQGPFINFYNIWGIAGLREDTMRGYNLSVSFPLISSERIEKDEDGNFIYVCKENRSFEGLIYWETFTSRETLGIEKHRYWVDLSDTYTMRFLEERSVVSDDFFSAYNKEIIIDDMIEKLKKWG